MFCQVTIRVHNQGDPRDVWFVAETQHDSLSDLLDELRDEGDVHLIRYNTRASGSGVRVVISSEETIQTRQSIVSVSAPQYDVIGQDGRVLHRREGVTR